jgi:hypothetical protein
MPIKSPTESTTCCIRHLARTGRGVMVDGELVTHPNQCIDGERARCSTCLRTWVHVCDEANGCSWKQVIPKKRAALTPPAS